MAAKPIPDPEDALARSWGFTDRKDLEYIAAVKSGIIKEAELIVGEAEANVARQRKRAYIGIQRWKHHRRERLV